jgi:murein DD-endopeptidase MepM/ murein hydrolase activator NlpD
MDGKFFIATMSFAFIANSYAQQVEVPREKPVKVASLAVADQPTIEVRPAPKLTIEQMRAAGAMAAQRMKEEMHDFESDAIDEAAPVSAPQKKPAVSASAKTVTRQSHEPGPLPPPVVNFSGQTAFIKVADGFDLPVGHGDAKGYYKARGFRSNGHLGEDWDGVGGGDTDLGDPVYCIGDGVVVFARDCHQGWGNVVIVRHAYREAGSVRNIDSLYGHLDRILVRHGQAVRRGQQIATIGNAHGLYDAHLHLEVRKNITIGMSRDKFAKDLSNYYDPSQFIAAHRRLQGGGASYRVAMNTFTYDSRIRWDRLRNYAHAHTGGGSSESAYALKKALATQSAQ